MTDVTIKHDQLHFGEGVVVSFRRTLRIPDDGNTYPLPPDLGRFPLRRVDDFASRVPAEWREKGGVFLPMYQREAMWLKFACPSFRPRAVKVGVGKVCAITGRKWRDNLRRKRQDYLVVPTQPWLDGIKNGDGSIRQFIAMPLGQGYTVEGQITGEETTGGVQLQVFEPHPGKFPSSPPPVVRSSCAPPGPMPPSFGAAAPPPGCAPCAPAAASMGLAAGGRMKQKIYTDTYGVHTWDADNTTRLFVHLCNSQMWRQITGERAPATPVDAKTYENFGLPWFDLYDEHASALKGSGKLKAVKSVKQMDDDKWGISLQDDSPVSVPVKKHVWSAASGVVRDGEW